MFCVGGADCPGQLFLALSSHLLYSFSSLFPSPREVSVFADVHAVVCLACMTENTTSPAWAERQRSSSDKAGRKGKKSKSSEDGTGEESSPESADEVSTVSLPRVVCGSLSPCTVL